jgi:hypothetical protein
MKIETSRAHGCASSATSNYTGIKYSQRRLSYWKYHLADAFLVDGNLVQSPSPLPACDQGLGSNHQNQRDPVKVSPRTAAISSFGIASESIRIPPCSQYPPHRPWSLAGWGRRKELGIRSSVLSYLAVVLHSLFNNLV